jgi:hypothetical protein
MTAIVDERQITPASIMEKFADQIHLIGDFEKALRQYKEALLKLQAEQETLQDRDCPGYQILPVLLLKECQLQDHYCEKGSKQQLAISWISTTLCICIEIKSDWKIQ